MVRLIYIKGFNGFVQSSRETINGYLTFKLFYDDLRK